MLRRMLSATSRRVGKADLEDLTELVGIRADLDACIQGAIDGLRAGGYTWESIGSAMALPISVIRY